MTDRSIKQNSKRTKVWSYGGGVQSVAIAALIVSGKLPPPDVAVIADTGYEQSTTWEYLDSVAGPALARVGVCIQRVMSKDLATVGLYGGQSGDTLLIPAFTDQSGQPGKLPSYCSVEWKQRVVRRWASLHGITAADMWLGISVDEMRRMSPGTAKWSNSYPLISAGMNRGDCVALVESMGWPTPPRSSCYMCPNHTQGEWRDIRDNKPGDWVEAVMFDRRIRERDPHAFIHHDCVPLDQADLDDSNGVLFGHGCSSGHCFV